MQADYSTLILTLGAISLLVAIAFAYYYIQVNRKEWNITLFLTAKIFQVFSGLLYAFQGILPDSVSILGGSFVLFASFCLELLAVTAFDKQISKRLTFAGIAHFFLFLLLFTIFHKNYLIAVIIFSFIFGSLSIAGVICLYYKRGEFEFPLFLAAVYALFGLSQLFRFTYLLFHQGEYDFLNLEWYDLQTVVATLILLILSPFGFLMAMKEVEKKELFVAVRLNNAAINQNSAPIIITNLSANIIFVNPAYERITGYRKDELLGKNPSILKSNHTPQDSYQELWDNLTKGKRWEGEFVNRKKNGEIYYEEATISPLFDEKGKPEYYIAIKHDISLRKKTELALRESEQRLKAVFANTITGITIIDKDGHFLYSNETSKNIHGYSLEDLVGKHYQTIVYPEDLKASKIMFEEVLEGQKDFFQDELRIVHKDSGEPIWVQLNVSLSKNSENKDVKSITVVYQNISRIKENQQELRELNATKDRFFKIIAHDLRNPLTAIIGLSEVLVENYFSYDDSQRLEIIEGIFETGRNSHKLLENLLEWSQAHTGNIQFSPQEHTINELIDKVIGLYEQRIRNKKQTIHIGIEENFQTIIDRNMMFTVIRNLVSNAVKFTPIGGKISIEASRVEDKKLELRISDTGVGIPEDVLPNLFKIDSNSSTPGTENESGTGIGLILCKEFVDKHKGNLSVVSNPEKGSTFSFTLDLA